jgi:sugar lactone lactonase YvrE
MNISGAGAAVSRRWRRVALAGGVVVLGAALTAPAVAGPGPEVIVLPGAESAEGLASGRGATFYAGDLFGGDIFRGNYQRGTAELLIDVPEGRMAVGMKFDRPSGLLFVAGGPGGLGYVYDVTTGDTVASYQFTGVPDSFTNDVAITPAGAWFTDSRQPQLYFVPINAAGQPGPSRVLPLTGPAADTSGDFNLNGIAATANGARLIVGHSANGALYVVNPTTGASATVAGVSVPDADGLVLKGRRLWVVQGFRNLVTRVSLSPDLVHLLGRRGDHQPAVPGARDRGAARQPAGGGERQVRHRFPAHRRPVRGRHRRPVTPAERSRRRSAGRRLRGPTTGMVRVAGGARQTGRPNAPSHCSPRSQPYSPGVRE